MSTTDAPQVSMVRDSGRTISGTAVTTVANFLLIAVVARVLGNEDVGLYSVAFALRALLVLLCGLGMRVALTRFVATHRAHGDDARLRGVVAVGVLLPVGFSLVVAAVLALLADWLATTAFDSPELRFPLLMVALSLPFAVLLDTCLAATQGFSSMRAYAGVGLVLEPALRLALTVVVLAAGAGLAGAAAALAAAGIVAGAAAVRALHRTLPRSAGAGSAPARRGELLRFAGVSWVASMATQGLLWADVVLLGLLVSDEEVGVYQVATRVVLAAMVLITPLTTAMAPRIAHLHAVGDRAGLTERYAGIVLWCWRLTLPLLVGVAVVPDAALAAFGDDFSAGRTVIWVLAAAAVVETFGAPSAVLLNQVGRNWVNMVINVTALTANVTLNLLLVPVLGIEGAAIAWASALVVPGLVRVVLVRRLAADRWPFGRPHAVSLLAAALAGGSAWLAVGVVDGPWPVDLLTAAVVVLLGYGAVVVALGLQADERVRLGHRVHVAKDVVTTRFPVLRRMRNRWHVRNLALGPDRIPIDELVSPFRYDVLSRVELFRLVRDHPGRPEDDLPGFVRLVAASSYRRWFDHVLVGVLGLTGASSAVRERVFAQLVLRGLQLYRSVERHGFDPRHPVTVARVPAGVAVGGRRLGEDRWIPMDGCHRLALMILLGRTHVDIDEYVVDPLDVRRYHTAVMARAERLAPEELLAFFARGLADVPEGRVLHTWDDLLEHLRNPENRWALESWPEARWLAAGRRGSEPDWFEVEERTEPGGVVG